MRTLLVLLVALAATAAQGAERIVAKGLFKDRAMLQIDGKQRFLRAGDTSPEGVTLVSATSTAAVIEVEGKRITLELGSDISTVFSAPREQSYRIVPSANGMFFTTGSVNGYPMRFIIDTGATFVSMNANEARRLGIDFRVEGRPAASSTAAGISKIYLLKLDRVKVGEIELRDVDAAVHEGDFPQITLLGMSFLGRLDIVRSSGAMVLRRRY